MTPNYCKANSISYREAGDRMRLSAERLVAARAGLRAHRVAAAVWGLTAGYSKAWDRVFIDGLAEATGMDYRSTRRGLKECVEAGALQWRVTRFKHGTPSLVGLPDIGPMQPHEESDRADAAPSQVDEIGPMQPPYLEPRTSGSPNGSPHKKTYGHRATCVECQRKKPVNSQVVCEACWKREMPGMEWVRDDAVA
jgi:hypothetical protein